MLNLFVAICFATMSFQSAPTAQAGSPGSSIQVVSVATSVVAPVQSKEVVGIYDVIGQVKDNDLGLAWILSGDNGRRKLVPEQAIRFPGQNPDISRYLVKQYSDGTYFPVIVVPRSIP